MHRRYAVLLLLSFAIVATVIFGSLSALHIAGLPFTITVADTHTGIINPLNGVPLPSGLHAGDEIDLPAHGTAARIAIGVTANQQALAPGETYEFMVRHGDTTVAVPVVSVDWRPVAGVPLLEWVSVFQCLLFGAITLLVLWRGRDRAALGLAVWAGANLLAEKTTFIHVDGKALLGFELLTWSALLVARVGFYTIIESSVGGGLSMRARLLWRLGFVLSLAAGAVVALGGPLLFLATGWAELLESKYGLVVTASYIYPTVLLLIGYQRADVAQKLRLRWMLWSSLLWDVGIFLSNEPQWGVLISSVLAFSVFQTLGIAGVLYAVLRHRVVDVSVAIDRTLVYGATTMLVVGVIAAVNSLALRATLGEGASLLLQVVVPLSLGIVLGKLRTYMDRMVERVFFRGKYLAEQALKGFGLRCGHIDAIRNLLESAVIEVSKYARSPGVALYEPSAQGYRRVQQSGQAAYPQQVGMDDPAMVEARAGHKAVDLSHLASALGAEACIFPITALGVLQGVLVCTNRPGEHFASDEKKLIARVARQVGAAWRILQARDNREFVRSIARGALDPSTAQARARTLEAAWSGL